VRPDLLDSVTKRLKPGGAGVPPACLLPNGLVGGVGTAKLNGQPSGCSGITLTCSPAPEDEYSVCSSTTVSGKKGRLELPPQAAPAEGRPKDAMCRDLLRLRHG
jgi:hypothetical protein